MLAHTPFKIGDKVFKPFIPKPITQKNFIPYPKTIYL
jgi:hypothetical protein